MSKSPSTTYLSLITQRFQQNRGAKWSYRIFIVLLTIAILNPFIAGDVPIYAKKDGKHSFPILKKYLIDIGLASASGNYSNESSWHEEKYEVAIFPLIPYSATYRDTRNIHFASPFGEQKLTKHQTRHFLGTDKLGRDVAAGMIQGVRTALWVGIISMLIATIIGIFMGSLAGYYGDDQLQLSPLTILFNVIAFFIAIHFAFIARSYQLSEANGSGELFKSIGIFIGIFLVINLLAKGIEKMSGFQKKVTVPADMLVMRLVEVFNSIPSLLLILAFAAIFSTKSLWTIILIIGFVRWTSIARFLRAELLKIRNMEYIQSAKAMGFSHARILFKHAIPNAIGPVLIIIAFGIAGAILLEAALSFLGIGIDSTRVTWGTLLRLARGNEDKWWLAIFPGLAIFVTVMIFNLMGEGVRDAIGAKEV